MNPANTAPKPRRLVVTRFSDEATKEIPYEKDAQDKTERTSVRESWENVRFKRRTATLEPLYPVGQERAKPKKPRRRKMQGDAPKLLPVVEPTAFFAVEVTADDEAPAEVVEAIKAMPDTITEATYLMAGPTQPPDFNPSDDANFQYQGYLKPGPRGIDMLFAQQFKGGDGKGIGFIDIEQGWTLNHEDLRAAGIRLLSGQSQDYFGHGTAVLGQMVAVDNDRGIVGIARSCTVSVVSQWQTPTDYRTDLAILEAINYLQPGDVLLLEAQVDIQTMLYPVEVEPAVLNTIRMAHNKGIIVIEAAGNGGTNLDAFGNGWLNRNSPSFQESGAIMVGAATSSDPHHRMSFSNFGSRIDCYGWGENIATTGDGWQSTSPTQYTQDFNGTSGASPMVAGIAVLVQAIRQANGRGRLWPHQMRALLSNPANGTVSANPASDQIGIMPDLRKIISQIKPSIK